MTDCTHSELQPFGPPPPGCSPLTQCVSCGAILREGKVMWMPQPDGPQPTREELYDVIEKLEGDVKSLMDQLYIAYRLLGSKASFLEFENVTREALSRERSRR